jgi:hypothetical protein
MPVAREETVDRRGLARERDVGRRHLRGHHRHEIVGTDQLVQRVDQRLADPA